MKKNTTFTLFSLVVLFFSGCAINNPSNFASAKPGCKNNLAKVGNLEVYTDFCIKKISFKPSKYFVSVNKELVFNGTDYTRVNFEKTTKNGHIKGECNSLIQIQNFEDIPYVLITSLPKKLIEECKIESNSNGYALAFEKDTACDKVYYTSLSPMLGKVIPVEIARKCKVKLNNTIIFEETFEF